MEWYLKNQDWVEGVITGGTGDEPSMAAANFGDLAGQKQPLPDRNSNVALDAGRDLDNEFLRALSEDRWGGDCSEQHLQVAREGGGPVRVSQGKAIPCVRMMGDEVVYEKSTSA